MNTMTPEEVNGPMVTKWLVILQHRGRAEEEIFAVRDTQEEAEAAIQTFYRRYPRADYLFVRQVWTTPSGPATSNPIASGLIGPRRRRSCSTSDAKTQLFRVENGRKTYFYP